MRILVLGGTIFVGRHIVDEALRSGHEVTLFHRGRHRIEHVGNVDFVLGDRRADLDRLEGRTWDTVIDTSGYDPVTVRSSARALARQAAHYVFISSASVYPDHSQPGLSEAAPTDARWDDSDDPRDPDVYGRLKAACELEVAAMFRDRHAIVRPGLLIGPHDPTDRFGYWPVRMAQGGHVLAPGPQDAPVQILDARDHARFVITLCENAVSGTFNATSPPGALTMGDVIEACAESAGRAKVTWVPGTFLDAYGIRPWTEMPLWPGTDAGKAGTMLISTTHAHNAGLRCRPIRETVADTLRWERSRGPMGPRATQLSAQRERLLLLIADEERWSAPLSDERSMP